MTTLKYHTASERLFCQWALFYSGASNFFSRLLEEIRLEAATQSAFAEERIASLFSEISKTETGEPKA